tara:strand:+ start:12545 stop:13075 length:531 start_codon:yes stop_codon:yes gene_type:complete
MSTNLQIFLERAKKVHGSTYDYSKVNYTTTEKKVVIICKIHGEFLMRPRAHYADSRGCPSCKDNKSGFSKNSSWAKSEKTLYLLQISSDKEKFLKVGVTVEPDLKKRFKKGQFPSEYSYIILRRRILTNASELEEKFLSKYTSYKYSPKLKFRGDSECFNIALKSKIMADFDLLKR